jgi:hypothetical protein
MSKRHKDAIAIQRGACNPSGVARSLVCAIDEARNEGLDTNGIRNDPAVRLIVHQLEFLCHISDLGPDWRDCIKACEQIAGETL